MWQKFRKREEAIKVYYKDKGEPARDHLPRTAVDGVISWEPVSMHWNIILSLHLETMPCVSKEGMQLPGRYYPTPPHPIPPPRIWRRCHVECGCKCDRGRNAAARTLLSHPTPPHLETMPCWVWLQVCQRKERSCQDVIIPPHPTPRIWRRCHVECGHKCVRGRNAAARTLLSHPTPPHSPASGDDEMLSVAASVSEEGTQRPGRYYPTPPHPPASGDDAMLTVAAIVTRMLVSESCGWWLGNGLFLVAKSSRFGCGIAFFWLRNRLFLVAESFFLVAEAPFLGCGSAFSWLRKRVWFWLRNREIWLRKRRNMVSESEFILVYVYHSANRFQLVLDDW